MHRANVLGNILTIFAILAKVVGIVAGVHMYLNHAVSYTYDGNVIPYNLQTAAIYFLVLLMITIPASQSSSGNFKRIDAGLTSLLIVLMTIVVVGATVLPDPMRIGTPMPTFVIGFGCVYIAVMLIDLLGLKSQQVDEGVDRMQGRRPVTADGESTEIPSERYHQDVLLNRRVKVIHTYEDGSQDRGGKPNDQLLRRMKVIEYQPPARRAQQIEATPARPNAADARTDRPAS